MAGVLIGLILLFLLFFILTRRVWLRVINDGVLRIQLHLPLLSLHLTDEGKEKNKKSGKGLSARAYLRVIAGTLDRVRVCEVQIDKIALPYKIDSFSGFTLVRPFGLQGIVYALIAYLKTKTKRLSVSHNAIISSPDITKAQYYITARLRLYQLINALLTLWRGINEEKKRAEEKQNVGE